MTRPGWAAPGTLSWLYRIVLFFCWCFFKLFHRHKVYGLEHPYVGAAIIAANHTSYLDPPILAISWPEEVHFLARESLFKIPIFGGFIRRLNSHPVGADAGDFAVFKAVVQILSEGKKLILFPEGRRAEKDELEPLKLGIAVLISRSNAAVIPTYIHGTYSIWSRNRKFPKLFGKTACVFGTPIRWEDFSHLEKKEAQRALAMKVTEAIHSLRSWYEAGAQGTPP